MVGENIREKPGVAARVFKAVGDINVRMISQGASEINMTFVVDESDAPEAVRRLHAEFFAEVDPEVFD
jgi:aspartate kinase